MQNIREVYSLLMPVANGRIVIPRAAVAEVTGFLRPKDRPENAPDFLLGFIEWQKQRIPLISFEAACGRPVPEMGRRARIAIVFGIEGRLKDPNAFAIVTQGYPYLVRVNEGVLQVEEMEEGDEDAPVLARARMANERPKIPDLGRLEIMLADALGITGDEPSADDPEPVDELDALATGEDDEEGEFLVSLDEEPESNEDDGEYDLDSIEFETVDDTSDALDDLDRMLDDDDKD